MITIESLVDMGANVRLEVTPTDLKMFAESIIQRTIVAQQEEQKAAMQREAEEMTAALPTPCSFCPSLSSTSSTMWRGRSRRTRSV